MSEREHLSAAGRASASEYVPSPREWSVGSVFVPSVVGASGPGRCVACRTFQGYKIGVAYNPYLVEREFGKCNKMMELSEKKSPSLSVPAGYFWRKVYF